MPKSPPLSVFCSYAHKDEPLRATVATGLAGLVRDGLIHEAWYDREISPGSEWAYQIDKRIDQADIILLLVSPNFISSDYSMGREVVRSLQRHNNDEARVVPIILQPCDWGTAPFAELQALPVGGEPLRVWTMVNKRRLLEISTGMRKVVQELTTSGNDSANRRLVPTLDASQTILAYLCNRVEQDRQLREAWNSHYESFALRRRPFVCVVHGPVQEDHAGYLRRLSSYSFPQEIGLGRGFEIRRPVKVRWPEGSADKPTDSSEMLRNLANELNCGAQINEVSATLYRLGETCVAYYELSTSSRNYSRRADIESFFSFWRTWPDLPARQRLIVVLSVQYRPGSPTGFPKAEADIIVQAKANERLSAVILDELSSVSRQQVKDWIRHQEVERFCNVENNAASWEAEIDATFGDRGLIPMEQLVGTLNRMLNEYQRRPA
jgi:hypothetical protein